MKTIFSKMLSIGVVTILPMFFIASCTTSSEPGLSESSTEPAAVPEAKSEDKTPVATVTPAEKPKTTDKAKKETVTPAAVAPVPTKPAGVQSSIYLGSDGKMAGKGDPNKPTSEAYQIGMSARPAALAGAGLPKDKFGLIDWVAVVDQGHIKPLDSLDPNAPAIPPLDMDVVIKAKGDFVKNVLYPHKAHTYWLDCQSCHPAIFVMAKGQNKMSMVEISKGEWCGVCHGKVAFPLTDCSRCHTQAKAKAE